MSAPWTPKRGIHFIGPALLGLAFLLFVSCSGGSSKADAPKKEQTTGTTGTPGGWGWAKHNARELTVAVFLLSPAFVMGGLVVIGGKWLWNRANHTMPNDLGMVPLDWKDAKALATVLVTKAQEIQEYAHTDNSPYGASVTHLSIDQRREAVPLEPPPRPIVVPSFAQSRTIFTPTRLYMGHSQDGPRFVTPEEDASGFVCALSGGGKSNLLALISAQVSDTGGKVLPLDLHGGHEQSFINRLGPLADERILGMPMGHDKASIRELLRWSYNELVKLIASGETPPFITAIIVDELNGTLAEDSLRDPLLALAKLIAQQGRKFRTIIVGGVQRPTIKEMGDFRDYLGWSMCGNVPFQTAPLALRIPAANCPKDTKSLPPGGMYIVGRDGLPVRLQVPLISGADLAEVASARLSRDRLSGVLEGEVVSGELETTQPIALVADVDTRPGDPPGIPVAEYRRRHEAGESNRQIIDACWGEGTGGRKYTRELKNLREATKDCKCGSDLHKEKVSV